jgi:hypothetical protein
MGTVETAFAVAVSVLAALAVTGALVFAVGWEVCAIRRILTAHRRFRPAYDPTGRWWREHSHLTIPERRP